jgi:hypothetical protein
LLDHERGAAVVVPSFPDDEAAAFGFRHLSRHLERPDNAFSSAGVAISM